MTRQHQSIIGTFGAILITVAAFVGNLYTDVSLLKHQMQSQNSTLIAVNSELTDISKDLTALVHKMDLRLTSIENED